MCFFLYPCVGKGKKLYIFSSPATKRGGWMATKKKIPFFEALKKNLEIIRWPLSSRGSGKTLVAGSLKKDRYFFCGFHLEVRKMEDIESIYVRVVSEFFSRNLIN